MAKKRDYAFTLNNYTQEDLDSIINMPHKYLIVGKEIGANETPHLQGYVYFQNPRAFTAIKKLMPKAHIEAAKGNVQQNYDYCTKQGDYIEMGEKPAVQGARTDLEYAKEIVKTTGRMQDVIEGVNSFQAIRHAEKLMPYVEPQRTWLPNVYWFYGPTGTGKTKTAFEMFPDAYWAMDSIKWWDGYDAHPDVIIDDYRKDYCSFKQLLRLTDQYPYRIENKGGTRQLAAKNIVITCPFHPNEIYDGREDIQQLLRRIKEIREFPGEGRSITPDLCSETCSTISDKQFLEEL